MTLTVSVIPASSKVGQAAIHYLLKDDITVRGFYRNTSKAPQEFTQSPLFAAVQGDLQDAASLTFDGSDVVFYVPPPAYDGTDPGEFASNAANSIKGALQKANVRRLVLLSAPGAQHSSGIVSSKLHTASCPDDIIDQSQGILRINHISDEILKQSVPEVFVMRPFYFYEDWAMQIPTLKEDPPFITSVFSPLDYKVPMVSIKDIGLYAARSVTGPPPATSPQIFKLYGPKAYSALDVRDAVARAINRDLEIKEVTPDNLREHTAAMVPESMVDDLVGLTTATLPGGKLQDEFEPRQGVDEIGEVTLEDIFVEIFGELKE
ncbi:uncharacterized protein J7T54_001167 [Emericellopsis cladophorae]|uniref:NAD(P)-binding domain-containing protein n=1 Tax=Emericellopsis cladophorae TaxID=2686198 RepID=A0A9P9Y033_9HYPO|nr:uncharacterized protein J7T54_001167 [Emericellopsis cladophorae]KAI6780663.1 hypothetical protein J7T54_001167 [Emericellopsis cladophorae]